MHRFEPTLSATVPDGWFVKESLTLLAPDGQANIIASSEPVADGLDALQYAQVQGDLLRKEFPHYQEHHFGPSPVLGGRPGYLREFSWVPPDGQSVRQLQLYFAASGRAYTATATTASQQFHRYYDVLRVALDQLLLRGTAPSEDGPRPPVQPSPPSVPSSPWTPLPVDLLDEPPQPPRFDLVNDLPAPAVPGIAPPPLPMPPGGAITESRPVAPSDGLVEPVLAVDLSDLRPWRSRLHSELPAPWSAAVIMEQHGPPRTDGGALLDDDFFWVKAMLLPEHSLQPLQQPAQLQSRLRVLHRRQLPWDLRIPLQPYWTDVGGLPAVLDGFARTVGGPPAAFSLSAEVSSGLGLSVIAATSAGRQEALMRVALPLARRSVARQGSLEWTAPPGWSTREELVLTTDTLRASATLVPLAAGQDLSGWTNEVFARAPFLRDQQPLAERPVSVRGMPNARLHRFDWQPSGMGRLLTSVAVGTVDGLGFSFVLEVPLHGSETALMIQADELLSHLSVA
ncbi:hypothetical protein GCM10009841_30430 [Microlunatus panaciterrae]|uniref:DUF1795 domain-containing protein n=1 Tax=Microlunatus panaciterrae TaxID=400768 RepID=A0ABS2RG92_9ACTN|nr:DcrB-related protein [Microlunatus panaciterrae]MBM7797703.1 hypothetical protein [Microlunatus panaciterrae]